MQSRPLFLRQHQLPAGEIANPPSGWNKLTINSKNSTTYVSKIWVNGLALVDPSIEQPSNDGAQATVQYQTKGGKGTIVDVDVATKALKIKTVTTGMSVGLLGTKQALPLLLLVHPSLTALC